MKPEPYASPIPSAHPLPARAAPGEAGTAALLLMLAGTFMVVLDFFIVNVALPSVQRDLQASAGALQLVVAGYGLANAAGLVTGGRLGDIHGRRRIFMLGMLLFALASLACGLAPNSETLVVARVLQGGAGALMQPQVLAMIGIAFAGERRTKAFAAYGLTLGLGAALGQLVGGLLIHADLFGLGWRSCFLINLPVAAVALLLAPRFIPPLANAGKSGLDLAGMLLAAATSVAIVLPLVEGREQGWPAWSWIVLGAGAPLLAVFLAQQKRLAAAGGQPLVAPALLAHRPFVAGLAVSLAFYVGNASLYFVLALDLQQRLGLPPLESGLVFTTMAVGFFLSSMAAPRVARRFGGPPIARGALLLAAGHLLQSANLAWMPASEVLWIMLPLLFVQGLGLGVVMAPLVSAILAGLPPQHAGVASGVLSMVQQAGNALGVALVGLVYYTHGLAGALLYLAACALGVALLWRGFRPSPAGQGKASSSAP
jgi:EmrB/QacA subfamily drug resistance transporter